MAMNVGKRAGNNICCQAQIYNQITDLRRTLFRNGTATVDKNRRNVDGLPDDRYFGLSVIEHVDVSAGKALSVLTPRAPSRIDVLDALADLGTDTITLDERNDVVAFAVLYADKGILWLRSGWGRITSGEGLISSVDQR